MDEIVTALAALAFVWAVIGVGCLVRAIILAFIESE